MKIVLNKGYGMFDLSHEAKLLLAKKKNIDLFIYYRVTEIFRCNNTIRSQIFSQYPGLLKLNADEVWGEYYLLKDLGSEYYLDFDKDHDDWWDNIYKFDFSDRTNSLLIEIVEELGSQANGPVSKLEVVEIPDGSPYYIIANYDGLETLYYSSSEIKQL